MEESDEELIPFLGDQTLAQSCRFMYDATVSREVIYAISDGDIGRVWEVLKVYTYLYYLKCDISAEETLVNDTHICRIHTWKIYQVPIGNALRPGAGV